ncbi:MAG: ASCH domain-containing protein [Nitrospirae bacterium]|nr:ASCH domain-containing protein [Nitrospirota bacterium]
MRNKPVLLSIRPEYAKKIFEGSKTVELRRVRPRYLEAGDYILIYVSNPSKSLSGLLKVEQVVEDTIENLWEKVKDKAGVSREEFNLYYNNLSTGIGIFFDEVRRFSEPMSLEYLKEKIIGFTPPQGFRYITSKEIQSSPIAELVESLMGAYPDN